MKGDVVVLPFPFSDLSTSKKRPALVAANIEGDDCILCQITSTTFDKQYLIKLENSDFKQGKLNNSSSIKINKLFTANKEIIKYKIGLLNKSKMNTISDQLCQMFSK